MKIFGFPATAWTAILVFLTTWLQTYLGNADVNWWVPTAIAVIGGVIKAIELISESNRPPAPEGVMGAPEQYEEPSKFTRWLVGP